jgi:hypothetical protein
MLLSARQFAEIVEHLGGPPLSQGRAEQRRAVRVDRRAQITIIPVNENGPQTPVTVEMKNISSRGVGLVVRERRMKTGSQFLVRLAREGGQPVEFLCTVVHCRAADDGTFSVGAEFTCLAPTAGPANPTEAARIRASMLG